MLPMMRSAWAPPGAFSPSPQRRRDKRGRYMSGVTPQRFEGRLVPADLNGIRRAAGLLRDGAVVAFPTETVYGLGADAFSPDAVAQIYALKQRPAWNPLIVHVP